MTTISIAMATFNGGRFLSAQLSSLVEQTILPTELVICDDNSTDDTVLIAEAFAARSPFPVRIEKNPVQLGYRANFMKAASLCRSDIVAFSDQDDVWNRQKLKKCLAAFADPDVLLTYHNASVTDENLVPIGNLDAYAASEAVNPALSMEPWKYGLGFTLLFRSALTGFKDYWPQSSDFFNETQHEAHDQWFCFLAACFGKIAYIDEPLVSYRQHAANTYGWIAKINLIQAWNNFVYYKPIVFIRKQISAARRAEILESVEKSSSPFAGHRAARAKTAWLGWLAICEARVALYAACNASLAGRIRYCLKVFRCGGYRARSEGGIGLKETVRDVLRGTLYPSRALRRATRKA
jgi:glycosyltransferase involved in cell wall biosynthesis